MWRWSFGSFFLFIFLIISPSSSYKINYRHKTWLIWHPDNLLSTISIHPHHFWHYFAVFLRILWCYIFSNFSRTKLKMRANDFLCIFHLKFKKWGINEKQKFFSMDQKKKMKMIGKFFVVLFCLINYGTGREKSF